MYTQEKKNSRVLNPYLLNDILFVIYTCEMLQKRRHNIILKKVNELRIPCTGTTTDTH